MNNLYLSQLDIGQSNKKGTLPKDNIPVGPSEKLVREEIRKLNENTEQLKKLREQVEKKRQE